VNVTCLPYADLLYSYKLFIIVPISTAVWVLATFLTSPSEDAVLADFVRKIRPAAFGWKRIYEKYDISPEPVAMPVLLLCGLGIAFVFTTCFGIGSMLFKSFTQGTVLLALAVVLLSIIVHKLKKI